ncbi:peptide-methionine (S)-S-oxide reductase MsrA [Roseomonas indoligenes]|uniref:Peptide methionine sulfoxide reductase MsrA n=1 Tax=Roseomonas indoligenes TaxID=2820811 RepID=A0A940MVU6_9PROT|nr:peptide-methionine (S)-S-oxide reductase MsrA [Pararoseomonas indoligenes]MBP0492638.1 peptide-methionine (S)-S-oxide reductase MsrA [Pararoseomonas indoligenes]
MTQSPQIPPNGTEVALLGGGCFWCLDAVYRNLSGVSEVVSGYAGGQMPNPTYEQVCSKTTGHIEVVRVVFDPGVISYADILRVFFTIHDPTTRDRQGADVGPQYRSVIFFESAEQEAAAREVMEEVRREGLYNGPIVTDLLPAPVFYPAEQEHQDYFARNPWSGYCRAVVAPKVAKFRKGFAHRLKERAA